MIDKMNQTTIPCSEELKNTLNKLKYHYGFKTLEEVIKYYIKKDKKVIKE